MFYVKAKSMVDAMRQTRVVSQCAGARVARPCGGMSPVRGAWDVGDYPIRLVRALWLSCDLRSRGLHSVVSLTLPRMNT